MNPRPVETIDFEAEFSALAAQLAPEIGETALAPNVDLDAAPAAASTPLTEADIDAFVGALNGDPTALSEGDQEFLAVNGMTARAMTAEELAIAEHNERVALSSLHNRAAADRQLSALFSAETDDDDATVLPFRRKTNRGSTPSSTPNTRAA